MPSARFDYYVDQCRIKHETTKVFSGRGVLKHRTRLLQIAREIGATSALDYGAGKGAHYADVSEFDGKTLEQALGFEVAKFDPAVERFAARPTTVFDLVWCTDVLEHVPEEDIAYVLADIASFATKAVFITVATYPAKKQLPNGENAHVTLKGATWWAEKIEAIRRSGLRIESQIA